MIKNVINDINEQFIREAQSSPQLLEDMASMEKYIAESYGERVFIELLQNADDAKASKIKMFYRNGNIYFANNGRQFNKEDIIGISRSGASSKKRGTSIGYRGVGFKSTCYLTDEIIIYSDETYFTFSKKLCAKRLGIYDINKVPTVRIPFLLTYDNLSRDILEVIEQLKLEGYTTVFIFKNAKVNLIKEEVNLINDGYFLFLNHLNSAEISLDDMQMKFQITREMINKNESFITINGLNNQKWYVVSGEDPKKVDISFKLNSENQIVSCMEEDAIFHCYLPTLEKTGYKFKVNSDFSTDPSRKHLILDSETEIAINSAAKVLFSIIKGLFNGKNLHVYGELLDIINNKNAFSKFSMLLTKNLNDLLKGSKWLRLNSGEIIEPSNYKRIPDWFEFSEFNVIRQTSSYISNLSPAIYELETNPSIEKFLSTLSNLEYDLNDWIEILSEKSFVTAINDLLLGKIYGNLIKTLKIKSIITPEEFDLSNCYIKTDSVHKLYAMDADKTFSKDFQKGFLQLASFSDAEWVDKKYKTKFSSVFSESNNNFPSKNSIIDILERGLGNVSGREDSSKSNNLPGQGAKISISKWRAAEQQCVEFEKSLGNKARDVSKQNLGYDVESITPDGEIRYIEVKSLSKGNNYFSMTNNEYSAAHQYGKQYYICLLLQEENKLTLTYINDPINNLNLEKRVRQWEWICEEYSGEQFIVDLK